MTVDTGAIVRLGPVTFFGDHFHGEGFHLAGDGLEGWTDGASTNQEHVDFAAADGEHDLPVYLGGRDVRLKGFLVTRDHVDVTTENRRLTNLLKRRLRIQVEEPDLDGWADGVVTDVTFDASGFTPEARFTLTFHMALPWIYGAEQTFPPASTLNLSHWGNAAASPVFEVRGTFPNGYTITGPGGRQVVVKTPLTAGHVDRIDMRKGRLERDGVFLLGAITKTERWTIAPSAIALATLSGAGGSGDLSATVLDTYI